MNKLTVLVIFILGFFSSCVYYEYSVKYNMKKEKQLAFESGCMLGVAGVIINSSYDEFMCKRLTEDVMSKEGDINEKIKL